MDSRFSTSTDAAPAPCEHALIEQWRNLGESAQQEIQRAAEERKRLLIFENYLQELEAVVADIERLA